MAAASWLTYARLAWWVGPRSNRMLFRLARRRRLCRIVEVGIGDIERTADLIRVAARYAGEQVAYTGLDWFDARPPGRPALTLKQAHCRLQATGARVRLVPGDPGRSLASVANAHRQSSLLLLAAAVADERLAPAWFFIPRMLDADSTILRERAAPDGKIQFEPLSRRQIAAQAGRHSARHAA